MAKPQSAVNRFFDSGTAEALSAGRALRRCSRAAASFFVNFRCRNRKFGVFRLPSFHRSNRKLQRLGITSSKVTAEGTEATLPTSHDHMSSRQSSMLSDAKSSMAMVDWCVVTLPKPEVMEYLLTEGEKTADKKPYTLTIALRAESCGVRARQRSVRRIGAGTCGTASSKISRRASHAHLAKSLQASGQFIGNAISMFFRNLGAGKFAIVEIDPKMMPAEHRDESIKTMPGAASKAIRGEMEAPERPRQPALRKNDFKDSETGGGKIELAFEMPPLSPSEKSLSKRHYRPMVAYTAKVAAHYIDIKDELHRSGDREANRSFISSGVRNVQLRLVHTYRTGYVESGTHSISLSPRR